jgi:hypothetical protein
MAMAVFDGGERDFGKHKRSSGLVCIFLFLQGLLCKMVWTAVPSVLFE